MCARARARVCVCVCVRERETEKERQTETQREREREFLDFNVQSTAQGHLRTERDRGTDRQTEALRKGSH